MFYLLRKNTRTYVYFTSGLDEIFQNVRNLYNDPNVGNVDPKVLSFADFLHLAG